MPTSFLTAGTDQRELEHQPIHGPHVIDGRPLARATQLTASPDRQVSTYLWDCTAGTFHWYFHVDEVVHILEGEVRVTGDDGHTETLRAGDIGHFPYGTHMVWEVPEYVRKFAVHRAYSRSFAARAGRKVKRLLVPTAALAVAPVVCGLPV